VPQQYRRAKRQGVHILSRHSKNLQITSSCQSPGQLLIYRQ
jgi:hypothetical protein